MRDTDSKISGFWAEEYVGHELHGIDLGKSQYHQFGRVPGTTERSTYDSKNVVYPSITNVIRNKAHEERPAGWTQGDHQSPNAHFLSSLFLKECLNHDSASYRTRWADEEGDEASTQCHGCIGVADCTSDVANSRAQRGDQPHWTTSITIADGLPEKGRKAENSNGHRS